MYIRSPSATQHGNSRSKANKKLVKLKGVASFLHLEKFFKKWKFLADDQLRCYLTASTRGNPILWDRLQNSYYRIQTSQTKLKSVWKCRQPGCKARVHTNDISNVIIHTKNEHTMHEVSAPSDLSRDKAWKADRFYYHDSTKKSGETNWGGTGDSKYSMKMWFSQIEKFQKDEKMCEITPSHTCDDILIC